MAIGGITPNVSTDALVFQTTGRQPDPIEQAQPNQLEGSLQQTDSVNISSEALELSRESSSNQKK